MISVSTLPGPALVIRQSVKLLIDSGGGKVLARRGWHFHVSSYPQCVPQSHRPLAFLFQLGVFRHSRL